MASAAVISFPSANITSPDPFSIDIAIDQNDGLEFLYSFAFDLLYDENIVQLLNVEEGPFPKDLFPAGSTVFGFDAATPGAVSIFNVLAGVPFGVTGDGVVATLTFRALMNGDAGLGFQNLDFVESAIIPLCEGDLETCSTFQPLAINGSPGTVTPGAPIPLIPDDGDPRLPPRISGFFGPRDCAISP
jgi:hypothetical protein